MSFPRYPKYKDSGVVWLGELPEHWGIAKFRHRFTESPEKIEDVVVGPMLSVSGYRGIELKQYDDENRRRQEEDLVGYRVVRAGQLVVNSMWLNAAGLGVSTLEGHVSPAYRCYWFKDESLLRRYAHHLLRSAVYVKAYTSQVQGIRPNSLQLGRDELMNLPILIPPLSEQATVAAFLDHETAKIDGLVAEQRRLIELLKEKRQAVISQAVTKGLNPLAPMKPSGIEWLGDVPEHWVVGKLGHVFAASPCYGVLVPDFDPNGIPMLRINDMTGGRIDRDQLVTISRELSGQYARSIVQAGDLVISVVGQLGVARVVDDELAGVNLSRNVARVQFGERMHSEFARWLFSSIQFQHYTDLTCVGTAQLLLNMSALTAFVAAWPPPDEQGEITRFLEGETFRIDTLISEATLAIDILQERRSALISAAVTGKIDVRELVGSEAA
jgi:type I restriction enzyme S subunit